MLKNVNIIERLGRFILGTSLLTWAIAGGPWWAYLGLVLLATGSSGFCPVYWSLKRD